MTGARAAVAVVTGVSVLALGACTGSEAEPRFAPTPSRSAGSSGTPTQAAGPVEPTMPAAARGTDAAAAEAFVRFYWEMVNYAQATGDVGALRRLHDACTPCEKGAGFIREVYGDGGHITGGEGRLSNIWVGFLNGRKQQRAIVRSELSSTRQVVDYPGRNRDKVFPAGTVSIQFLLRERGPSWSVLFVRTR